MATWEAVLTIPKGASVDETDALIASMQIREGGQNHSLVERDAAFEVARICASHIINQKAIGSIQQQSMEVKISGHANDNNTNKRWQERDNVTITISQITTRIEEMSE